LFDQNLIHDDLPTSTLRELTIIFSGK